MKFFFLLVAAVGCSGGNTVLPPDSNEDGEDLECPEFEHIPVTSPQIIGQPSRLKVLTGLIEHALKHPNVWIGRCDEMVEDMRPGLERANRRSTT